MATTAPTDGRVPRLLYVVVAGHLGLLLVPQASLTPFGLGLAVPLPMLGSVGLLALLLGGMAVEVGSRPTLVAVGALLGLAGVTAAAWLASETLWVTAGCLIGAWLTAAYGLHRYERVMLGLVTDETQ